MALMENSRNVEGALKQYKTAMVQLVLPTPDDKTFRDAHGVATKEAIKYFVDRAFFDKDLSFQTDLNVRFSLKAWYLQSMSYNLGMIA